MRAMGIPVDEQWRARAGVDSRQIEGGKDRGPGPPQRCVLEPLRMDDRFQIEERRLEQGVDYNEVELIRLGDLDARVGHPLLDRLGVVLAAPFEAKAQLVPARRQDEDEHRVGEEPLDLQRACQSISSRTSWPPVIRSSIAPR